MTPLTILITGCSSGIGRATALHLLAAGHRVYAMARDINALRELAALGAQTLALDVTDEVSMVNAVRLIEAQEGRIDVLVNNAGYGEMGPVEEVPLDRVRQQFETNVFGLVRLTQLVLPGMRARHRGRIVNISSLAGRITFPIGGFYAASKHAVEAISDALRGEVLGFGVHVSLIEPGHTKSEFGRAFQRLDLYGAGPYAAGIKKLTASIRRRSTRGASAEVVAIAIEHAATAVRPRIRYVVPGHARTLLYVWRLVPTWVLDRLNMRMMVPRPKTPKALRAQ